MIKDIPKSARGSQEKTLFSASLLSTFPKAFHSFHKGIASSDATLTGTVQGGLEL